jgi:iron complex outermembrane receptor protein
VNPQFNSELFVEKADFLRMDNVSLGYTLPRRGSLRSTRVFATLQNAFTASGYGGVDPLAGGLAGIDNNTYPLSRIFTLGLTVGF